MHRKIEIFKLYFSFLAFSKPLFVFDAETNDSVHHTVLADLSEVYY